MVWVNTKRKNYNMKKKLKIIFLSIVLFIFSKISFAANDKNIYDKIDLFGEV